MAARHGLIVKKKKQNKLTNEELDKEQWRGNFEI